MSAFKTGNIVTFDPKVWAEIEATDPVVQFYKRVGETAQEQPDYGVDFRRALERASVVEYSRYVIETHGHRAKKP